MGFMKTPPYLFDRRYGFCADGRRPLVVVPGPASRDYVSRQMSPTYLKTRWVNMMYGPKGQAYKNVFVKSAEDIPF